MNFELWTLIPGHFSLLPRGLGTTLVIIPTGSQLLAGDHDFTKFSIIPSVVRYQKRSVASGIVDTFRWCQRSFWAFFSSTSQYSITLDTIIERNAPNVPVLFIYSDGGPDPGGVGQAHVHSDIWWRNALWNRLIPCAAAFIECFLCSLNSSLLR